MCSVSGIHGTADTGHRFPCRGQTGSPCPWWEATACRDPPAADGCRSMVAPSVACSGQSTRVWDHLIFMTLLGTCHIPTGHGLPPKPAWVWRPWDAALCQGSVLEPTRLHRGPHPAAKASPKGGLDLLGAAAVPGGSRGCRYGHPPGAWPSAAVQLVPELALHGE